MPNKNEEIQRNKLLHTIIDGIQEVKGHEIVCLNLTEVPHAAADYFVICHGNSDTQVDAIARAVERETMDELRERPWHKEGQNNSEWVLLDYFNVVVHIFHKEARKFYELEDMWADAEVQRIENRA
ncbi:ribosome silencing factor [Halocola ammonii]